MTPPPSSPLILGGGLAGTLLADALLQNGCTHVRVLDHASPRRASNVLHAMVHPFVGRTFKPMPYNHRAFAHSMETLERWSTYTPQTPILKLPMLRPILDSKSSQQLFASWETYRDLHDDVSFLSPEKVTERFPHLLPNRGAITYSPALSVPLGALLPNIQKHLQTKGVSMLRGQAHSIHYDGSLWTVQTDDGGALQTSTLVIAVGHTLGEWFPGMQGGSYGGELLSFHVPETESIPAPCLASSSGIYVACGHGTISCGATRWRGEEWEIRNDDDAAELLLERASSLTNLPLRDWSYTLWRGVRWLFMGNRMPLCGPVPNAPNLYLLGALGSRGLLQGPLAATSLARLLMKNEAIPDEVHTKRVATRPFKIAQRWTSPKIHTDPLHRGSQTRGSLQRSR